MKAVPFASFLTRSFVLGLAGAMALWATGCASSAVRMTKESAMPPKAVSAQNKVAAVTVELNDEAKEKLKDNLKFNQDALREQVERALRASELLDPALVGEAETVHIIVTSMRVRSNFSAIMWGAMAGADNIQGLVVLKDSTGREVDRIKVKASYALGGIGGGQDAARMDWLYEAFAKETLEALTGKK